MSAHAARSRGGRGAAALIVLVTGLGIAAGRIDLPVPPQPPTEPTAPPKRPPIVVASSDDGLPILPGRHTTPAAAPPAVPIPPAKATTKVVHGSACKDDCRQGSVVAEFLRSCLGHKCRDCECGTPRTYRVLTTKTVPGPDTPVCQVKDFSALSAGGKRTP